VESDITNRGAGAGNVQRCGAIAAGGAEIGECRVTDNGGGAGNIPTVGSGIIVECEIADSGAGAVNIHLGLHGSGGCEHRSGENEFDQSFHIFDIVVFVVLASGHRTAFTEFIAIGFRFLTTFSDALTEGVIFVSLTR